MLQKYSLRKNNKSQQNIVVNIIYQKICFIFFMKNQWFL